MVFQQRKQLNPNPEPITQQQHKTVNRRNFLQAGVMGAVIASSPISFSAFGQATKPPTDRDASIFSFEPYELKLRHAFNLAKSQRTTTPGVQVRISYDGLTGYGEASMPPYLGESVSSVCSYLARLDLSRFSDPFRIEDIHEYLESVAPETAPQRPRWILPCMISSEK